MKTRTLLLLALGCGLAIMAAGAVFLVQLATQDGIAEPIPIGRPVVVGDMTVTVTDAVESAGTLAVRVRIGGVDDPDGALGFRLLASGRAVGVAPPAGDACTGTTVAEQACVVRFDVSGVDGTSRQLFYERGEDQARWVLSCRPARRPARCVTRW